MTVSLRPACPFISNNHSEQQKFASGNFANFDWQNVNFQIVIDLLPGRDFSVTFWLTGKSNNPVTDWTLENIPRPIDADIFSRRLPKILKTKKQLFAPLKFKFVVWLIDVSEVNVRSQLPVSRDLSDFVCPSSFSVGFLGFDPSANKFFASDRISFAGFK